MGIVFLSEEDLDLRDFVTNRTEKELNVNPLPQLISDYFIKGWKYCRKNLFIKNVVFEAVDWINKEGELAIPCSKVAIARTGLSQLKGVINKSQFTANLVNSLGGVLVQDFKELFAQQVRFYFV